jgi:hypothetical protein
MKEKRNLKRKVCYPCCYGIFLCEEPVHFSVFSLKLWHIISNFWALSAASAAWAYSDFKWFHGQIYTDGCKPWDTAQVLCKSCFLAACINNIFLYIQKQCFFVKLFLSLHCLYFVVSVIAIAFFFNFKNFPHRVYYLLLTHAVSQFLVTTPVATYVLP